jgi:hypothetical protein
MNFEHNRIIKDIKEHYDIDISYYIAIGLLHIEDAKFWLVKNEYLRLYKTGSYRSYKEIKEFLIERYSISQSCIEKMIYRNHKV